LESKVFTFEVGADRTAEQVMAQARAKAREVGIAIQGDAASGSFKGAADGRYTVEGNVLRVEVEKKPAFVPWKLIEGGLKKLFGA
jgi:hypothetical protein